MLEFCRAQHSQAQTFAVELCELQCSFELPYGYAIQEVLTTKLGNFTV